jgi:acid phosphatase (class A)
MNDDRLRACTWRVSIAAALIAACSNSTGQTQDAAPAATPAPPAQSARTPRPPSYVNAATFDYKTLLPPAPQKGSARYESDRQMFLQTRRFKDTPRWLMAASDADAKAADFLRDFSCALDVDLTPANAPLISKLAQNLSGDSSRLTGSAKDYYKRDRPYLIDDGATCRPAQETGKSFDYPSGHATAGWAWASALADVAPERAYGESRIVCGVHNVTAVEAARLAATAVALLARSNVKYQADLAAARTEYATLTRSGPHPETQRCADEAALVALPLD